MTDVTIRGIEDDVYARFSAEARMKGVSIGELVTLVMRAYLEESTGSDLGVSNIHYVEVTEEDLKTLDGTVSFSNIPKLEFKPDVTWQSFSEHVTEIRSVARLIVPPTFPRLSLLTKCRNVGRITHSGGS